MTGMPVVYLFFAQLMPYGTAIAVLCFARRPSWFAIAIILFDLVFYLDRILVTGKRAETIQLVLMFLLAFWFYRRIVVPRTIMAISIFGWHISHDQYGRLSTGNPCGCELCSR